MLFLVAAQEPAFRNSRAFGRWQSLTLGTTGGTSLALNVRDLVRFPGIAVLLPPIKRAPPSAKLKDHPTSMTHGAQVVAIYPGSFDPITNGHLDVIERGSKLFDRLIVSILHNEAKAPLFSIQERAEMLCESVRPFGNVEVDYFRGLLADYALSKNARVILRGIRAVSDYEYELQMALMNRRLQPQVETVFLLAGEAFSFISSRLVKEVISLGGNITGLVPPLVEQRLRERLADN